MHNIIIIIEVVRLHVHFCTFVAATIKIGKTGNEEARDKRQIDM